MSVNIKKTLDQIQAVRAANNKAWMDLCRVAWEVAPVRTKAICRRITKNDAKLLALSKQLAK